MTLKIGNLELNNPFVLAPLAGVTDAVMRRICSRQGASLTFSEMVSCKGLLYNDRNTEKLLHIYEDEGPVGYQLFGNDPAIMGEAAAKLKDRPNKLIDINMGCPVPKIVRNGEGSALLNDPDLAGKIVESIVKSAGKPVTVKMRIGFTDKRINAAEFADVLQSAGASAIAVHGRTRQQYYSGKADWDVIGEVKARVGIPVMGNGDIFSGEDAVRMLRYTGCDMAMIARGAMGNPWIFRDALDLYEGRMPEPAPSAEEKAQAMKEHFLDLIELKGEYVAVREMRKFTGWYLKGIRGAAAMRRKVNTIDSAEELTALLDNVDSII